jgi:DNA repair/transcription protein MET18/MMS19
LQSLSSCLPVYGSALARSSARKLWSSLKLEVIIGVYVIGIGSRFVLKVFHPIDSITEGEALNTTQVLVNTIHADDDSQTEDIRGFAREACEECIDILREPEKSLAKPAIKILCAFISTMRPCVQSIFISIANSALFGY